MRDPYSVLGVKRDAGADEIKAAWRSAAKASHPDQNRDDPDATKRFAELSRAFDVLKDPAKRSRYDMQREKADARKREQTIQQQREAAREAAERAKAAKANAERVMADLAKAEAEKAKADKAAAAAAAAKSPEADKAKAAEKPADKSTAAKPAGNGPSPEDVVSRIFGDTPEANAAAQTLRRESEAQNVESDETLVPEKPASLLDPIELISALLRRIRGKQPTTEKAPDLFVDASVTIEDLLKGAWVTVTLPEGRSVRFVLEPGVSEGHLVRLKNQGLKIPGMLRGDVAVTVKVAKDPSFSVDGFDIHTILPITLEHAVLGTTTNVNTPEGETEIVVPAWSGSDQSIRLAQRGLRDGSGTRGDLVVELRVLLWEKPDDKVTDLMRVMREGLYL
ncbi:DnaJ C-terminal domain-containing protein [Rhizobium sp. RU36D]|uniref:DnaJ C-terminal domain-containing protein n=1 Tax=Rhizobium sp. RU36D TaxID=1907415 RepID=UPI000A0510CF|nr:DnaJ C-terminal domain-containing protein [Rhizobium sp. RU36D]